MKTIDRLLADSTVNHLLTETPFGIVDAGAFNGLEIPWSFLANRDHIWIYSFEPHPEHRKTVPRYINGSLFNFALGDHAGDTVLHDYGGGSSLKKRPEFNASAEAFPIQLRRLDGLHTEGLVHRIDFLKTDCELFDYAVINGCGTLLDHEVAAIQAEIDLLDTPDTPGLPALSALLQSRGFLMMELSHKRGRLREISGGDVLFVRDVRAIDRSDAAPTDKKRRMMALVIISALINNFHYARSIIAIMNQRGFLPNTDAGRLDNLLAGCTFLPDAMGFNPWRLKIASALTGLAQLAAGGYWRSKSAPADNRIRRLPMLTVGTRWLPSRQRRRLDADVANVVEAHLSRNRTDAT